MSAPRLKPPSTITVTFGATASTISGSALNDATDPSSMRPPWLETMMPSTPQSAAMPGVLGGRQPLDDEDACHRRRIERMSSQVKSSARVRPGEVAAQEASFALRHVGEFRESRRSTYMRSNVPNSQCGAASVCSNGARVDAVRLESAMPQIFPIAVTAESIVITIVRMPRSRDIAR